MRWALFFLAEYTNLVAGSALASTLFLAAGMARGCPLDLDDSQDLWVMLFFYVAQVDFPADTHGSSDVFQLEGFDSGSVCSMY